MCQNSIVYKNNLLRLTAALGHLFSSCICTFPPGTGGKGPDTLYRQEKLFEQKKYYEAVQYYEKIPEYGKPHCFPFHPVCSQKEITG